MARELVVNVNSETLKNGLTALPMLGTITLIAFFLIRTLTEEGLIRTILLICLGSYAILMFAVSIAVLFKSQSTTPAAILNDDGIWTKQFGLIPWNNIRDVSLYRYKESPLEMVGIYVHNTKQLSKQASFNGKSMIFWSKRMGTPPITLSNVAIPNNTVVNFAKQFIAK